MTILPPDAEARNETSVKSNPQANISSQSKPMFRYSSLIHAEKRDQRHPLGDAISPDGTKYFLMDQEIETGCKHGYWKGFFPKWDL